MHETSPVTIERTGSRVRAADLAGNSVAFGLTGWDELTDPHEFDEPIDAAVVGRASELRYDLRNFIGVKRLDDTLSLAAETRRLASSEYHISSTENDKVRLPDGEYRCRLDASLFVKLRFDGAAKIRNRPESGLTISFRQPTRVTLGFKSPMDYPRHELTVEPTTAGIATGLSHLSVAVETTSADRVHRYYRGYPPSIAIGDETRIPGPVERARPETGIELLVPDRLSALFPAAPLAYYLGARLRPTDVRRPILRAPSVGLHHEFDGETRFDAAASKFLRRAFFLDLMASWHGTEDWTATEFQRLEAAGITLGHCADGDPAERVAAYADVPSGIVDEVFPPWPYRMTVEPTPANATVLPHLLYDMAAIDLPSGTDSGSDAVATEHEPSSQRDRPPGPTTADQLSARRQIRGVLGDAGDRAGFRALPAAYENRLVDLGRERDERTVTVVFADERARDRAGIVDRYACRTDPASPTVSRLDDPTCEELATAFADGADFLHFVGECDETGLVCRDSSLSPASLSRNEVRLFQLDAPDSRATGIELIEAGSIAGLTRARAGAVDAVSTVVGELVLYGHCLASAQACATDLWDADTAVVGDGTHRFEPKWKPLPVQSLTPRPGGGSYVTIVPFPVDPVGVHWHGNWTSEKHLSSATITFEVDATELTDYLAANDQPIYYDGRLYWMDEQNQLIYPIA